MTESLYQDQLDPDGYGLDITPGDSGLDLSTVASAEFRVLRRQNGTESTWTATLSAQTATTLTLTYLFAADDIDTVKGTYDIYARLTLLSGKYCRTVTRVLNIKGKFEA